MKLSFRLLGALALYACFVSCKKDDDNDNNNNANKTRLSKLISFRTATPSKNITTTEFIYDDQKRVIEIAKLIGDSVGAEIKSSKHRSMKFFYNGNDKNPYMSIGGTSEFVSPAMEIYYSYDVTGTLIRDSIATPPMSPSALTRFFYFPNTIVVENEIKTLPVEITKDSFVIANQNLTEAYSNIKPSSTIIYGNKLKYDDKINPISKLNISTVSFQLYPFEIPSYLMPGFFKNNITELTHGSSNTQGQFTTNTVIYYSYTYDANNLPEECRFNNGFVNTVVKYYYVEE